MTTTTALHWIELYLGETHYYAEEDSAEGYTIQWYMTDATLYIFFERHPEIDIRLEREVYMVKYQDPLTLQIGSTAVIALRILPSRPLIWAKGTEFKPGWGDSSQITLQIDIMDKHDLVAYKRLTGWMSHSSCGAAKCLNPEEALQIWTHVSREILDITDKKYEGDCIEEKDPIVLKSYWGDLRQSDIDRLQPERWANDQLISYGLKVLKHLKQMENPNLRCHMMETFCYSQINEQGLAAISKWTGKVDIFEQDFILFPINENLHWFLVIVDQPGNLLRNGDDEHDEDSSNGDTDNDDIYNNQVTKIYVMNSLPSGHPQAVFKLVESALVEEAKNRLGVQLDVERILHMKVPVPMQTNAHDCGFYLLHYAHMFMDRPDQYRGIIYSGSNNIEADWRHLEAQNFREQLRSFVESDLDTST